MFEGRGHPKESTARAVKKFLTRRLRGEIKDARFWLVVGVIIISVLLFWSGALIYAYVADDLSPAPADERSMPPPRY